MSQARRNYSHLALMYLDLDGFKPVNDRYGHETGDDLLKAVATNLLPCVREVDTVARLGGDEFAIILGGIEHRNDVAVVAGKVVQQLASAQLLPDLPDCRIGVSIGIALYPEDGAEIDGLMSAADTAMYSSKHGGKNRYTFYQQTPDQGIGKSFVLETLQHCGLPEIDQQHAELNESLNRFGAAILNQESLETKGILLEEVIVEARKHFAREEELFVQHGYAGGEAHKTDHEHLLREALHFKERLKQGEETKVLHFLRSWLVMHILHADKPFADFLARNDGK
jgi:diguanylate cyclase (GGDEF)-like protein/hemerythrin-like metal-binding protein